MTRKVKAEEKPYESLPKYRRKAILLRECGHRCQCGQGEIWNGKKLCLQMDHIDGDPHNVSKANERILCPNCHTQTPTYCQMDVEQKKVHRDHILKGLHEGVQSYPARR